MTTNLYRQHIQKYTFLSILKVYHQDMSSYVAVQGIPRKDSCSVFGLTPKEVRYLKVISDWVRNINSEYEAFSVH